MLTSDFSDFVCSALALFFFPDGSRTCGSGAIRLDDVAVATSSARRQLEASATTLEVNFTVLAQSGVVLSASSVSSLVALLTANGNPFNITGGTVDYTPTAPNQTPAPAAADQSSVYIAVGVCLGALLLVIAGYAVYRRRRQRRLEDGASSFASPTKSVRRAPSENQTSPARRPTEYASPQRRPSWRAPSDAPSSRSFEEETLPGKIMRTMSETSAAPGRIMRTISQNSALLGRRDSFAGARPSDDEHVHEDDDGVFVVVSPAHADNAMGADDEETGRDGGGGIGRTMSLQGRVSAIMRTTSGRDSSSSPSRRAFTRDGDVQPPTPILRTYSAGGARAEGSQASGSIRRLGSTRSELQLSTLIGDPPPPPPGPPPGFDELPATAPFAVGAGVPPPRPPPGPPPLDAMYRQQMGPYFSARSTLSPPTALAPPPRRPSAASRDTRMRRLSRVPHTYDVPDSAPADTSGATAAGDVDHAEEEDVFVRETRAAEEGSRRGVARRAPDNDSDDDSDDEEEKHRG